MSTTGGLTKREFGAAVLFALVPTPARASFGTNCVFPVPDLARAARNLAKAYPDFIAQANEHEIHWRDGTRMQVQLHPLDRPYQQQVEAPDLASQLLQSYPSGDCEIPASPDDNPGRIRYEPFFAQMYGASATDVRRNLTSVQWPSKIGHGILEVTQLNGVAVNLKAIANELMALPTEFRSVFDHPAGGFYWRTIAGTKRLSGHAFGIAVDMNINVSDYWRNEIPGVKGEPVGWRSNRPRNRIPRPIVDIFERHGFIWGGKWYHYDTMHFEYRPELLLA